jgi:hypothetical protein
MGLAPRLNLATYAVTRSQLNPPENGRPAAPSTSTLSIVANMQPANGETLKSLPEARHSEDLRVLFTSSVLKCEGDGFGADIVTIAGKRYEVISIGGPWPGHYEVVVSKVDRP